MNLSKFLLSNFIKCLSLSLRAIPFEILRGAEGGILPTPPHIFVFFSPTPPHIFCRPPPYMFCFCRGPLSTRFYFWLPLRPSLRNSNRIALTFIFVHHSQQSFINLSFLDPLPVPCMSQITTKYPSPKCMYVHVLHKLDQ